MTLFPIPAAVVERLGWVLLHSVWQFAGLALLAWLAVLALQRYSATVRYIALLAVLVATLAAPAVTVLSLPVENSLADLRALDKAPAAIASISAVDLENRSSLEPLLSTNSLDAPQLPVVAARSSKGATPTPVRSISAGWSAFARQLHPWLNVIVGLWCLGVLAFACRPILSWFTVRRLRTVGVESVPESIHTLLTRTSQTLRLRQTVRVLQSSLLRVPVVVGYLKPVILLPASIVCGLPMSQLEAILAHELAHVRRHDYLVNLLQTLIETVFFYHPAVWWISDQIRTERENCCDDIAVTLMGNRVEYGRALLALEELRGRQTALVMGANGASLLARVQRLFASESIRRRPSVAEGLVVTSLLVTMAIALCIGFSGADVAIAQPSKLAEPKQSPPATITTRKPALRPAELPAASQMQFHQWDKEFRHTSEESFLELELAAEELVKKTPDRDRQASIYAQVAHIASQSNITKHAARVQKFARRALELSRDPLQRTHMHGLVGQGILTDSTIKNEAEKRRLAANSYVTGYAELLAYDIPEVAPEPPPVGGGDKSEQDPAAREKQRLINEAQVAAWKQAHYIRDLVFHRKVLLDLLNWLYHPNSNDRTLNAETQAELRAMASKLLPNEAAAETLLSKVNQPRVLNAEEQARSKTAPGSMLDKEIAIHYQQLRLHEALALICTHAGAELELDREGLKSVGYTINMPVTVSQGRGSVRSALESVLQRLPELSFTRVGKTVFVSTKARVASRQYVAQVAVDAAVERFAGNWRVINEALSGRDISQGITYQIQGKSFSRLKDGGSYGLGSLEIDPALSPPTFILQFEDSTGDARFIRGSYAFHTDGSLSLSVADTDDRPPEGAPKTGQAVHQINLQRIINKAAEASTKAPSLEFRFVANAPEVELEPRLPADYLQKHYRDATGREAGTEKDKGFAWFPISNTKSGDVHIAIERTVETQRLGLLSDVPEHALLADGKWKIAKCVVAPGENGDQKKFSIMVTLDEAGGKAFQQLTKSHLNQQLAIVVGGTIVASPMVRNEIGREVMVTGKYSLEEAEQLAATISPDSWKQLFDCTVVDSVTGQPIAGNDFTIHFRFQIPTKDDAFAETVDNLIWGPKSGSQIKFSIPPRTLRHPDFDKIVVRWGVSHPDYETFTSPDTIPVSQLLRDEPNPVRDRLRQIKLTKKKTATKVWRIRAVSDESDTPVADVKVLVRPWAKGSAVSESKVVTGSNDGFVEIEIPEPGGAFVSIEDDRFFGSTMEGLVLPTEPKSRLGDVWWSKEHTWKLADETRPAVLRCWRGSELTGQLLQPDGRPAANARLNVGAYIYSQDWRKRLGLSLARVSWDHGQWPNWQTSAVTGADGKFRVRVPPYDARVWVKVGSATLSFGSLNDDATRRNDPGTVLLKYVPFQTTIATQKVETSPLDIGTIKLQSGVTLRGRVIDQAGKPVPNVQVVAEPQVAIARDSTDFSPFAGRVLQTDADGQFEFAPLHPGKVKLEVHRLRPADGAKHPTPYYELSGSINAELPEGQESVTVEIRTEMPKGL